MKIDAFITPFFPETETQFKGSIVVMIDVLRASTTICAAIFNGAKEIITCESTDKAVNIYSSLSKSIRFLGGERNCIKPSGFDAGNSPEEYSIEAVKGKTVIITTTNGTKLFQKAKQARMKIVAGFINIDSVLGYIKKIILKETIDEQNISFLCAGTNGRLSYEDTICAGAFINNLVREFPDIEMTDSAHAVKNLYNIHSDDMKEFLKTREHALILRQLGFEKDCEIAFSFNIYPVVPIITGNSIKLSEE
jgi:2-phosphosulfolactate phosphatase